jgi:hypothetical protein
MQDNTLKKPYTLESKLHPKSSINLAQRSFNCLSNHLLNRRDRLSYNIDLLLMGRFPFIAV